MAKADGNNEDEQGPPELKYFYERFIWRYCKALVKHPGYWLAFYILIINFSIYQLYQSGGIAMSKTGNNDWTLSDTPESRIQDAIAYAQIQTDSTDGDTSAKKVKERTEGTSLQVFFFMYDHLKANDDKVIWNPQNLQDMCELEAIVVKHEDYKDFCKLQLKSGSTTEYECAPQPLSVTSLFYGMGHDYSCPLLTQTQIDFVQNMIYSALETDNGKLIYGFYVQSGIDKMSTMKALKTRSMLQLGQPLAGYDDAEDRKTEQRDEYLKFFRKIESKLFEKFSMKHTWLMESIGAQWKSAYIEAVPKIGDLKVEMYSYYFQQLEFDRLVSGDLMWALAAIAFVFCWIRVHTGTFWTASMSMFCILTSMPMAILVCRYVFQVQYFSQLHVLAIFLVLGVGADDVFVFNDAYSQSFTDVKDFEETRSVSKLYFAFVRSMQAVFNTSFTTAMAFASTAMSPIMPISSFGYFAAMAIIFNYIFVLTIVPCTIVLAYEWFLVDEFGLLLPVHELLNRFAQALARHEAQLSTKSKRGSGISGLFGDVMESKENKEQNGSVVENWKYAAALSKFALPQRFSQEEESGAVGTFLSKVYKPFMLAGIPTPLGKFKVFAVLSVCVTTLVGVLGLFYASQLTPPTKQEEWFASNHMMTGITDRLSNNYLSQTDNSYREITLVWGIEGIDRKDFNRYYPDINRGETIYQKDFSISSKAAQESIVYACEEISKTTCSVEGCSGGLNKLARPNSTKCFMTEFRTWNEASYASNVSDTYQLNEENFMYRLKKFRSETKPSWDQTMGSWKNYIGMIGGELKYITVRFTSTLKQRQPVFVKKDVQDVVKKLVEKIKKQSPASCNLIHEDAGRAFVWMQTELALVNGLLQGLYICFPVAFCVLLLATSNIITSFFASATIAFIVGIVLGYAKWVQNWDLGIAESITGVIVIGFSVDYVVHLGHMYTDGEHTGLLTRDERFSYSIDKMGGTVIAGAITTAGAGACMYPCQMTFFGKMYVFIVCVILASIFMSLFFFMAVMAFMGPSHKTGNVLCCVKEKVIAKNDKKKGESDIELGKVKAEKAKGLRKRKKNAPKKEDDDELTVEDVEETL